ncbi:MAG: ComEC/Rec2 family competence protein [Patescibacteria group bacterium]
MNFSFFNFSVLSFVAGIAICSVFDLGVYFGLFLILLSGVLLLVQGRDLPLGKSRPYLFIIFFFLFFGLGFLRCSFSNTTQPRQALDNLVGREISAIGIVVDEPDEREDNTKLTVEISEINNFTLADFASQNPPTQGATTKSFNNSKIKILLTIPHYPQFEYGDKIEFFGKLQKPKNFKSDNNREFDYIKYLAKDGIFYQMFYLKTELVSKSNGNFIKEKLFAIKRNFLEEVGKTIPEPQVSLLGGLLLGTKQSLGQKLQDDFRKVGLIHIVVLSGYNITIIAEFITGIFSFLPRMIGLGVGAVSIVLFAIMVGGSATIIRASIMALLVVLARATGRVSEITRALFLAGFVMVMHNPQIVVFDPSFQLSFVATLGLICLSPKISKIFKFIPNKFYLRDSAVATISTQIFVLPLLLYMMGEFSIVAIFVNLLVLMLVPLTMFFGFLAGIIGFVASWLALPFSYLTYFLLSYELTVVELFASLPFASFKIPPFSAGLMFVIYGLYFLFLIKFSDPDPVSEPENSKIDDW